MASMTCALIWVVERSSADVSAERGGGEKLVGDGEGEGEAEAEGKCFEIPDVSTSMMVESSASGEGVRTGGVKTNILLNK
jgi:hypothetical protein